MLNLTDNVQTKKDNKIPNLKKKFSFNNKHLKNMPLIDNLNNIEILFLNDNEISTLSFCQNLPNLKELYMVNNKICDLKEIDYLYMCKKLHIIYLKGNPIQLNDNQLYIKKIRNVVSSIKIIDGLKIIPSNKLNLYMFLKGNKRNRYVKYFNKNIFYKKFKNKNIIYKNITRTEGSNETEPNKIYKIMKEYRNVEKNEKISQKHSHFNIKKSNSGNKIFNYIKFNYTLNKKEKPEMKRRKSEVKLIKRIIDKNDESSYTNKLIGISNEESKNEFRDNYIFNSVSLLLNGLNLLQLKQLQNYVHKKLSTNIIINKN